MMLASESKDRYLSAFKQSRADAGARDPGWLGQLRESAIASFDKLGFPTTKHEDWKYTSVEPISGQSFVGANGAGKTLRGSEVIARSMVEPDAPRLVFVNGVYASELSQTSPLPPGLTLKSLSEFVNQDEKLVAAHLGHYADAERQSFVALNSAFMTDGAVVSIGAGCRLSQAIYLVFVSTSGSQPVASHPRTLIVLGAGSEAKIVESYVGLGGGYFCNAVSELAGAPDAVVEHYRIQQAVDAGFHVGSFDAALARGCRLTA
ncbi:MAG: Fe-S cluster assembly protein SufD, partial [Candidatus Binatia bacterium]